MVEHKCLHEVDLALMAQELKVNTELTTKIFNILEGDNSQGLKTIVAINRVCIKRLWWWVGGMSMAIIGAAIFLIRARLIN